MIYFKEIKTPEEVSAIYKSIQDELVEFEPNETVEELSKSYALDQEEIVRKLKLKNI
jgi:hypothetical protein